MNKEVFVMAGGMSLQNYNLRWFRFKDTITINKSIFYIPSPDYFITIDQTLLKKITDKQRKQLKKLKCEKIFIANFGSGHLIERHSDGAIIDKRWNLKYKLDDFNTVIKSNKISGIGLDWNDFRTGDNSGFCGLQLAILKGYTVINLVGMDLVTFKGQTHFHGGYGESERRFQQKLVKYYKYWEDGLNELKIKRPDIKVYSCSPISSLNKIIPYKKLK